MQKSIHSLRILTFYQRLKYTRNKNRKAKLQKFQKFEQIPENNLKFHLHQLNYQASTPPFSTTM